MARLRLIEVATPLAQIHLAFSLLHNAHSIVDIFLINPLDYLYPIGTNLVPSLRLSGAHEW